MKKIIKEHLEKYWFCCRVYWCIAGIMALFFTGWRWGSSGFDKRVLKREIKKRFLL